MRLRRSALISPSDNWRMIEKLAASPADVCILELEDGIYETRKEIARQQCAELLHEIDWRGRERVVRINALTGQHGIRDIEIITAGRPDALLLAKVQSPEEIDEASRLLTIAEERAGIPVGSTLIWSMIETALGLVNVEQICRANSRMTAVLFGAGDLGVDLKVKRLGLGSFRRTGFPAYEYAYGKGRVVAAARAAGLDPIDVGHSSYTDVEGTRMSAEYSAQMGFAGIIVYNPRQIPIANELFSPPAEDIAWAEEVVSKFEEANRTAEKTVVVVNGEMIDGPFVLNAQYILARARQIQDLEHERR
jgi:citrate lyase subunit beta / citryl-CoA lyase